MAVQPSVVESEVRAEFRADWSLIHTDKDRWLAFRAPGKRGAGFAVTEIEADTLAELAELLREAGR